MPAFSDFKHEYLCQFGDPLGLAEGLFQFEADAKQAEVIAADPHRLLLRCSRQWGKSTTAAALVALVVIVLPTLRQTAAA